MVTNGFRSPLDLQVEGRDSRFEQFNRLPGLILRGPDGNNHAKTTPAIYLLNTLNTTNTCEFQESDLATVEVRQGGFTAGTNTLQILIDGRITLVTSGPGSGGTAEIIMRRRFLNEPPVISVIPNQFMREGQTLTFTAIATDPDGPANRLRYELPKAPAGARIDPNTGVFTWTPTEAQGPGANLLTVFVYDDGTPPLNDSTSFTVSVTEVNTAPALPPITSHTLHAGMPLRFNITATDPDLPPNTLSYALSNAPPGVTIDATSGLFAWPPGAAPANTTKQTCTLNPIGQGSSVWIGSRTSSSFPSCMKQSAPRAPDKSPQPLQACERKLLAVIAPELPQAHRGE